VKMMTSARRIKRKFDSGPDLTAKSMVEQVEQLTKDDAGSSWNGIKFATLSHVTSQTRHFIGNRERRALADLGEQHMPQSLADRRSTEIERPPCPKCRGPMTLTGVVCGSDR
jgi:hypothetical protein